MDCPCSLFRNKPGNKLSFKENFLSIPLHSFLRRTYSFLQSDVQFHWTDETFRSGFLERHSLGRYFMATFYGFWQCQTLSRPLPITLLEMFVGVQINVVINYFLTWKRAYRTTEQVERDF